MGEVGKLLVLRVRGMTCSTCEKRVGDAAASVAGVLTARADQSRGSLTITFDPGVTNVPKLTSEVGRAVAEVGYTVVGEGAVGRRSQAITLVVAGLAITLFLFLNAQGWFNVLPTIDSSIGLGMVFIAGLLTSLHCVAMCGGLALSQQNTGSSPWSGLAYHGGRVVSYTILGAVVGGVGSVVSFSPAARGLVAGVAGVFMVVLGLKMLGLVPKPSWLRLPRLIPARMTLALRRKGRFFVGLANGLMPCGPLQTMQLYALGTGSLVLGALSMFLFSVGTVPLMFTFGILSRFFSSRWQHRLVRASAVLVVFFGVVMAGRALELSGVSGQIKTLADRVTGAGTASVTVPLTDGSTDRVAPPGVAVLKDGFQYVSFDLQPNRYLPITVQKGIPVRWTINASEHNLNGCNGEVVVPQLNLRKKLVVGPNLIEFTPAESGTLSYTCWMGMINSSIRVVDNLGTAPVLAPPEAGPGAPGGCCGAGTPPAFADGRIPVDLIQKAVFKTEAGKTVQEVTVTVDDGGYSPAVVVVQKGLPTRFRFVAKKLSACNGYVDFPAYGAGVDLSQGQRQTPLIPVVQDFVFQCGMGMLHGYVRVVDDLSRVDLAEVKATAAAWRPEPGSGGCCGG